MQRVERFMSNKTRYLIPRIRKKLISKWNQYRWQHFDATSISLKGFDAHVSKDSLVTSLLQILGEDAQKVVLKATIDESEAIKKRADYALNHIYDYLGSGPVTVQPMIWNIDLKTRFQWQNGVFYTQQIGKTPEGSDKKFPWEISRSHHLLWLGETYLLTKDEKYAKEVVWQIKEWIRQNPIFYTVNWTCSMDVAIRAVNWMYAILFISESEYLSDDIAEIIYKSLYQHGYFIIHNLEKTPPYSNNHYLSDIVGLLFIGQLFKNNKAGKQWYDFALHEFYTETDLQVFDSGVNYERSVQYHRLVTELVLYSYCMLVRRGEKIPAIIEEKTKSMIEYVRSYTMPNGASPMVADNDDGRFLPFVPREFKKHSYIYQRNSLENRIVTNCIYGNVFDNDICQESKCFRDANIAILRREDKYLFINCCNRHKREQQCAVRSRNHLHNDLLSFVYSIGNDAIIIDPGAYCYTMDKVKRKEFRSTSKHNTVLVDSEEQNLFYEGEPFNMIYNTESENLKISQNENSVNCLGEYSTRQGRLNHKREFCLSDTTLSIIDKLSKHGVGHEATLFFHLDSQVNAFIREKEVQLEINGKNVNMSFETPSQYELAIIDDTVSPSFGVIVKSKTVVCRLLFDESAYFHTIIK